MLWLDLFSFGPRVAMGRNSGRFLVCVVKRRKTGLWVTHRADQFVGVDGPQKAKVAEEATDDESHLRTIHILPKAPTIWSHRGWTSVTLKLRSEIHMKIF